VPLRLFADIRAGKIDIIIVYKVAFGSLADIAVWLRDVR
jgi:hypothetical protein